jgi:ubiquinone biosynthesis protein UbiJ
MVNALQSAFDAVVQPAVMERATLLVNHVLAAEPVAAERLRPHAGRSILLQFEGWPGLLPSLPVLAFRITPAALGEWCGSDAAPADADLRVAIDASNPALALVQALGGKRPQVDVAGDAAFAADVSWLLAHLRWDVQDDLARLIGQVPAHELARLTSMVAEGLRAAVGRLAGLAGRAPEQPPR